MRASSILFVLVFAFHLTAQAGVSETDTRDASVARIAKILKGRSLVCSPDSPGRNHSWERDFFPLQIRLKDEGNRKTSASIKNKVEGGFAGSGEYLTVEASRHWLMFKDGDDGYNLLTLYFYPAGNEEELTADDTVTGIFAFMGGEDPRISSPVGVSCSIK